MKKAILVFTAIILVLYLTACSSNTTQDIKANPSQTLNETASSSQNINEQSTEEMSQTENPTEGIETMEQIISGSFAVHHVETGKNLRPNSEKNSVEVFVSDGNGIVLYPHQEWKCMTWNFSHIEGLTYQLQNLYTGKTFQPSSDPVAGISIWQQSVSENNMQYWEFIKQEDETYLIRLKETDLYLTITSDRTNSLVILMPKQNTSDQIWKLIEQYPSI